MRGLVVAVVLVGCAGAAPAPVVPASPSALAQLEASRDLDGVVIGPTDAPATLVVSLASWCEHCRAELVELDAIRHRHVRVLAVDYRGHEEYDHRGGSAAIRAFAHAAPWLRIVPADDALFDALGRPPLVPTIFIYDRAGSLVETFDRRQRAPPDRAELTALLQRLGA